MERYGLQLAIDKIRRIYTYVVLGVVKSYGSFAALLVSLFVGPWVRFLHLQPKNGKKKAGSPGTLQIFWDALGCSGTGCPLFEQLSSLSLVSKFTLLSMLAHRWDL